MIIKGFRFGMLLQLAVGPMCLLVFNTAGSHGFYSALMLVSAIALIDALFIFLSGIGTAALINKKHVKQWIKIFGAAVLVLFGANTIAGALGGSIIPSISLFSKVTGKSIFVQGILLTASNPLTIIFWSGVFSTQIIENKLTKLQLALFGTGCVLSTLCFLTAVAFLGSIVGIFLSKEVIKVLNICVGIVLIYFGIKMFLKK